MYTHIYIGFFCLFILVHDGMCVCICVPQTHLNCHQETCPSACWSISHKHTTLHMFGMATQRERYTQLQHHTSQET